MVERWGVHSVLLVSTLVHDVDHNGLNNNFHINSQSPLAVLYNDISVLENHHCSFAAKLIARTENNILANMDTETQKTARSLMIQCILSTDMSTHFDVTNKFKLKVEGKQFSKELPEDRQSMMNFLMHAADLSNPARPFEAAKRWAWAIIDEFTHPKTGRHSTCYRVCYRSMDRSLTNAEVDLLQEQVRDRLSNSLGVELR